MQEDLQPFWCTAIRLRAPLSVCDNAPPDFVQNNPEMLIAFSTSERKDSKREFFDIWSSLLILNRLKML